MCAARAPARICAHRGTLERGIRQNIWANARGPMLRLCAALPTRYRAHCLRGRTPLGALDADRRYSCA